MKTEIKLLRPSSGWQQRLEELRGLSPEFMQNESSLRLCASRSARAAGAQKEALQRLADSF